MCEIYSIADAMYLLHVPLKNYKTKTVCRFIAEHFEKNRAAFQILRIQIEKLAVCEVKYI